MTFAYSYDATRINQQPKLTIFTIIIITIGILRAAPRQKNDMRGKVRAVDTRTLIAGGGAPSMRMHTNGVAGLFVDHGRA